MTTRTLDFPNKRELSTSKNIEFSVFIPSTRAFSIKLSSASFRKRMEVAIRFFTKMFDGSTIVVGEGSYKYEGKTIKEKVGIITVNATRSDYNKYDETIEKWIRNKKKTWGQDSMGFVYQGKMIFI